MAFSTTVASKQPDEEKTYIVDFSAALSEGETISVAVAAAYKWDDRNQVLQTFDLETAYPADEVYVALSANGTLLISQTISLAAPLTKLLVQAINEDEVESASGIISAGSLGWDNTTAYLRLEGGENGHTYKVTVKVTTTDNNVFEADIFLTVEAL